MLLADPPHRPSPVGLDNDTIGLKECSINIIASFGTDATVAVVDADAGLFPRRGRTSSRRKRRVGVFAAAAPSATVFSVIFALTCASLVSFPPSTEAKLSQSLWPRKDPEKSSEGSSSDSSSEEGWRPPSEAPSFFREEEKQQRRSGKHGADKPRGRGSDSSGDFAGTPSILDRLRRYHSREDALPQEQDPGHYSSSPSEYIRRFLSWGSTLLHYVQTQLLHGEGPASSFFDTASSSSSFAFFGSSSSSSAFLWRHNRNARSLFAEPRDSWEGLLSALSAVRVGYVEGVSSLVDSAYEAGRGCGAACAALLLRRRGGGGGSSDGGVGDGGVGGGGVNEDGGKGDDGSASYSKLSSSLHGLAVGAERSAAAAFRGVALIAAGVLVGARNLAVGVVRTPGAMRSKRMGMVFFPDRGDSKEGDGGDEVAGNNGGGGGGVWDYYDLDMEADEINAMEERMKRKEEERREHRRAEEETFPSSSKQQQLRRGKNKRRRSGAVKDRIFYDRLDVRSDATDAEIRSAYRREALKVHPDKKADNGDSSGGGGTDDDKSFLDLTEAYRVLGSERSRDEYDRYGVCFRSASVAFGRDFDDDGRRSDAAAADGAETTMPTHTFFDDLFGTDRVREYVGVLRVASIVDRAMGFEGEVDDAGINNEERERAARDRLRQRRRVVDIAKHLRKRTDPYVRGETTLEMFAHSCRREAVAIVSDDGDVGEGIEVQWSGAAFLEVIGRTLMDEADRHRTGCKGAAGIISPFGFVRRATSDARRAASTASALARVYAPIYLSVALEGIAPSENSLWRAWRLPNPNDWGVVWVVGVYLL